MLLTVEMTYYGPFRKICCCSSLSKAEMRILQNNICFLQEETCTGCYACPVFLYGIETFPRQLKTSRAGAARTSVLKRVLNVSATELRSRLKVEHFQISVLQQTLYYEMQNNQHLADNLRELCNPSQQTSSLCPSFVKVIPYFWCRLI